MAEFEDRRQGMVDADHEEGGGARAPVGVGEGAALLELVAAPPDERRELPLDARPREQPREEAEVSIIL